MNKSIIKRLSIVAVLLVTLSIYVFDPFIEQVRYSPIGLSDFRDNTGNYKINAKTILASLDNGETNVFTAEITTPDAPMFEGPVLWQQSDYLKITDALHQFVWKEMLDDWSLYYMDFITTCQDNPNGFALGDFYYFKTIFTYGKLQYSAREMLISPQYGHVTWGDGAIFPHPLLGWKSINLEKIKITAEEALKIAEENGGKEVQFSVQNNCKIQVRLTGHDTGWKVRISENTTADVIFRMTVDPYTGEIK